MNSTAANLPRLRIFYTFYIFYTAITTPLSNSNSSLQLQLFTPTYHLGSVAIDRRARKLIYYLQFGSTQRVGWPSG